MFLDGLHQASTVGPLVFAHRRIGHLGPLLHPRASDVLVIGLGGGATAGAASQYPYAHTEVVELSRAVIEGASFFSDVNYDLLKAPNVTVMVDDGRSHLQLSGRRYDVIMADIIQPIHAAPATCIRRSTSRWCARPCATADSPCSGCSAPTPSTR